MAINEADKNKVSEENIAHSKDQDKVLETKEGEQTNPLGNELNILVSLPESLEIKMVNASILADYEIWIFIASVLSSAMSGFWVAYTQTSDPTIKTVLFWNSTLLSILFLIAVIVAFTRRNKLSKKSKSIKLKATK